MPDDKLPESITGAVLSWILAAAAWTLDHINYLAVGFAVVASIYSIRAARETIKLRKIEQQLKQKELNEHHH